MNKEIDDNKLNEYHNKIDELNIKISNSLEELCLLYLSRFIKPQTNHYKVISNMADFFKIEVESQNIVKKYKVKN